MRSVLPIKPLIQKLGPNDPMAAHRALDQWRAEHLVARQPGTDTISRGLLLGNEYLLTLVYAVLREHLLHEGREVGDDQWSIYENWCRSKLDPPQVVMALIEDELRTAVAERVAIGPLGGQGLRLRYIDDLVSLLEFQWLLLPDFGDPDLKEQIVDDVDLGSTLAFVAEMWSRATDPKVRLLSDRLVVKWNLNNPGQVSHSVFIDTRLSELRSRPR